VSQGEAGSDVGEGGVEFRQEEENSGRRRFHGQEGHTERFLIDRRAALLWSALLLALAPCSLAKTRRPTSHQDASTNTEHWTLKTEHWPRHAGADGTFGCCVSSPGLDKGCWVVCPCLAKALGGQGRLMEAGVHGRARAGGINREGGVWYVQQDFRSCCIKR
jgi:hypothetical protein